MVKLQLSGRVLDEHTLESAFSQEELKAFWKPMRSSQADPAVDAVFIERTCAAAPCGDPHPNPEPDPDQGTGRALTLALALTLTLTLPRWACCCRCSAPCWRRWGSPSSGKGGCQPEPEPEPEREPECEP